MAGGFMSGFGPAFAQAFTNTRKDIEQREDDVFKLKYTDFLRTRDERNATAKEEKLAAKQAAALAEQYKSPDAAKFLYDQIMTMGLSNTQAQLQQGLLTKDPNYKPLNPAEMEDSNPDLQTEMDRVMGTHKNISSAGMNRISGRLNDVTGGEYEKILSPTASPYDNADAGGYKFNPAIKPEPLPSQVESKVAYERAVATGNTAEAAKQEQILSAYRWAAVEQMQLKAAENGNKTGPVVLSGPNGEQKLGRIKTPTGAWDFVSYQEVKTAQGTKYLLSNGTYASPKTQFTPNITHEELNARRDIAEKVENNPVYKATFNKTVESMSALQSSATMRQLLSQPGADFLLSNQAASLSQLADNFAKEGEVFIDVVGMLKSVNKDLTSGEVDEETDMTLQNLKANLEKRLTSGELQGELAQRAAFLSQQVTLVYTLGRISDPGGRLNTADVENFFNALSTSKRPETYIRTMDGLIGRAISSADAQNELLLSQSRAGEDINQFSAIYGYTPKMVSKVGDIVMSQPDASLQQAYTAAMSNVAQPIVDGEIPTPTGTESAVTPETPNDVRARAKAILEQRKAEEAAKAQQEAINPEDKMPEGAAGRKLRRER